MILIYRLSSLLLMSPSPRRAWIEIDGLMLFIYGVYVALPTEGVD